MPVSASGPGDGERREDGGEAVQSRGESQIRSQLIALYIGLYAAFGTIFPYLNLYLRKQGWSGDTIGLVGAVGPLVILLTQPLWGLLGDWLGASGRLLALGTVFTGVMGVGFLYSHSLLALLVVSGLWAVLRGPLAPLLDAITLDHLGTDGDRYGRFRLFGSLGWAITTAGMGVVAGRYGLESVFWAQLALFAVTGLIAAGLAPQRTILAAPSLRQELRALAASRGLHALAGVMLVLGTAIAIGENFFSILLDQRGGATGLIGLAWMGGAIVEMIVFYLSPGLLRRWNARVLLIFSSLLYALRFLALGLGWVAAPGAVALLQITDGLAYASFNTALVLTVNELAPSHLRATSQSAFSAISFSLGSVLGNLLGGWLLDPLGAPGVFVVGGGLAVAATGLTALLLPPVHLSHRRQGRA
ncbi:MAG: MFS transporter [Limnochordaceae bacterium]|nr:MFS transporter [Limnochordaceae bacterium]